MFWGGKQKKHSLGLKGIAINRQSRHAKIYGPEDNWA